MSIELFLKALLIGMSIAMPVGPMALLCIEKTLKKGWKIGLLSGLAIALGDATYGLVAGLGLTSISSFLINYEFWLRVFGGGFIIYLGYTFFKDTSKKTAKSVESKSEILGIIKIYFLTLTSPATILSFVSIFLGLGIGSQESNLSGSLITTLGIFAGSFLWWIILVFVVSSIRSKLSDRHVLFLTKIGGVILIIFGLIIWKELI
ncbi:MAG: LysE family transporter [bacterium]